MTETEYEAKASECARNIARRLLDESPRYTRRRKDDLYDFASGVLLGEVRKSFGNTLDDFSEEEKHDVYLDLRCRAARAVKEIKSLGTTTPS